MSNPWLNLRLSTPPKSVADGGIHIAGEYMAKDMKRCTHCMQSKPVTEFYKRERKDTNVSSKCKDCERELQRIRDKDEHIKKKQISVSEKTEKILNFKRDAYNFTLVKRVDKYVPKKAAI